jgi:mannose-6-phosphate isomerase-like protein (cupin superfamily)
MLIKHLSDHFVVNSATCGEVRNILKKDDHYPLGVAVCIDIQPTEGHFHRSFDETYFVLDGEISLEIYDPHTDKTAVYPLKANELCVISKGLHHKIIKSSAKNRLCVISYPPFHADDEHPSDKI